MVLRRAVARSIGILLIMVFGLTVRQTNSSEVRPGQADGEKKEAYLFSILGLDTIPPPSVLTRTAILNTLADKFDYQSYLEIGQGHKEDNFNWITCRIKIGVDPNKRLQAAFSVTSDEFFALNHDTFDLIFIDGLHRAAQVERDIANSLKVLKRNGTIVVHDCNPGTEDMQIVPRQGQGAWTGDVWKTWVKLRAIRTDLRMYVVNVETGCGIIRRGAQKLIVMPEQLTYDLFVKNRRNWLNLVEVDGFLRDLKRHR